MRPFLTVCAVGLCAAGALPARASLISSVDMTSQSIGGIYPHQYNLTLHNKGDTPVGTLWYAWDDSGLNFLPSAPVNITAPANWFNIVTYSYDPSSSYTYGIEWYTFSPLAAGQSLSGFSFQSTDTPATLAGISNVTPVNPGDPPFPVGTTFVYMSYPAQQPGDAGFQFVASPNGVPEPASLGMVAFGACGLLMRRRKRIDRIRPTTE
jgi:hypothetical protein